MTEAQITDVLIVGGTTLPPSRSFVSKFRTGRIIATSESAPSIGNFARRMRASNSNGSISCSNLALSLLGMKLPVTVPLS